MNALHQQVGNSVFQGASVGRGKTFKGGRPRKAGPRHPGGKLVQERPEPPRTRDAVTGEVTTHDRVGYVYVIGPRFGSLKIGSAFDPEKRRIDLQAGSPFLLMVHYAAPVVGDSARSVEMAVHRRLHDRRAHGEWFSVSRAEAVAAIEAELVDRRLAGAA
jgi:hypothetical protein